MSKSTEYHVLSTNLGATIEKTSGVSRYSTPEYNPDTLAGLLEVKIQNHDAFDYFVSDQIFIYLSIINNIDAIVSRLLLEQTQPGSQIDIDLNQPSVTLESLDPNLRLLLDIFYLSHGESKYAPERYSNLQLQYLAEHCNFANPNRQKLQELFDWIIEAHETLFNLNLMAYLAFVVDAQEKKPSEVEVLAKKYVDELKLKLKSELSEKDMRAKLIEIITKDLNTASLDVEDGLIHWAIISKAVDQYIFPEKGRFLVNFRDFTNHDTLRLIYKALRDWKLQVTLPAPKTN